VSDTYADFWHNSINETYDGDYEAYGHCLPQEEIPRVLMKAAKCLRGYTETVTLTAEEFDLVRYLMPAHEVLQSGSVRWVRDVYDYYEDLGEADYRPLFPKSQTGELS
jgi:hypothetical protein